MPIDFFIKETCGGATKNKNISNKKSAEELYKPIIRIFKKRKVYSTFVDNILDADLSNMQLISKFDKIFKFLLYLIEIFGKYAWVTLWKDKRGTTITNAFQKVLKESFCKPNKVWVDKGSKFHNRSVKSWIKEKNDIEIR